NPRIVAVKDAKGDLHQASRVMAATDLVYYCGEDALNLPWLSSGAAGTVSVVSQVSGELEKAMIEAVDRSDLPAAREANRRLVPLVEAIMAHMPGAVAAKAALHLQGVLPHAAMRGPHVAADADQLRMLTAALDSAGLLCPARRPDRPTRSCSEVMMSTVFSQRLPQPPPLPEGTLRIVPLGGLGDVGRNMTVLEFEGRLLIVDCGVLFPEDSQPGVDLILPDFDHIADRLDDVAAIVLTHGHEDHIGAVPYLLRQRPDIPLVGSQLTRAFIESRLKEHRIRPYTLAVAEGQKESLGPFDCEFIAVNHSIPDALAVHVTTPAGTVLHTGDFKMDQLPLDGRITDL